MRTHEAEPWISQIGDGRSTKWTSSWCSLLNERTKAALEIGKLKKDAAMAIYEPGREKAVFDHVFAANPGPLPNEQLQHIYERIIDVMRTLQQNSK